ncbi:MAG TPA: helix-turn-helix domain-containing protein [Gammaproteobacteria bacterium]|nr:helix-turn-helix domain-containing protein [Gammaproteobacteria bacterium]
MSYDPYQDPLALMTGKEVAAMLKVSPRTLEQWRAQRTGPTFIRLSQNTVRYRRADIETWQQQRTEG